MLLKELEMEGQNISFDALPNRECNVDDESIEILCEDIYQYKVINANGNKANIHKPTKQNLLNWKVLIEKNNHTLATNAYAILTQKHEEYFPYSKIQCARFRGTTRAIFIDKKEYYVPAYKLIDHAEKFLNNYLSIGLEIDSIISRNVYEIHPSIIRELLNNAITHRSYIDESAVQVNIFDDHIEITSPGSLYGNLTLEDIQAGKSSCRNKILSRVFREMGIIEEWGTGLIRVIEYCKQTGLQPPEFIESGTFFRVNIYRPTNTNSVTCDKQAIESDKQAIENELNANEIKIMQFLSLNPFITNQDVRVLTQLSPDASRLLLIKLVQKDLIYMKGMNRHRRYYKKQQ